MFSYDAALRIGVFLGFLPERVYLVKGARQGATALGVPNGPNFLLVEDFPPELQSLQAHEIHHFLCVYKKQLLFFEEGWEEWNKQIEKDAVSGKLDFLIEEAFREKMRGQLKEL
jgi:hypothetical protein